MQLVNAYRVRLILVCSALLAAGCASNTKRTDPAPPGHAEAAMHVRYLEIVTPDVDATCDALAAAHGVTFSEPIPELGNARTAPHAGGRLGVRAPMRETESPVVRPYVLVEDIGAAVEAARAAGAEIAMPPTELPGQGTFAIYILGGIQHGLWQD